MGFGLSVYQHCIHVFLRLSEIGIVLIECICMNGLFTIGYSSETLVCILYRTPALFGIAIVEYLEVFSLFTGYLLVAFVQVLCTC